MGFTFASPVQATPSVGEFFTPVLDPGLGVFVVGGKIYALLYTFNTDTIGFWVSADGGNTWNQLSTAGPFPNPYGPGSDYQPFVMRFDGNDTVYIAVPSAVHQDQVWSYIISTDTWATFGPPLITAIFDTVPSAVAVFPNGNLFLSTTNLAANRVPNDYAILSGGAWSALLNISASVVPAPGQDLGVAGKVGISMLGASAGAVFPYASPDGPPNIVPGVTIANNGTASNINNAILTAIQADSPNISCLGFAKIGAALICLINIDDGPANTSTISAFSYDGSTWTLISTQVITPATNISPLSSDGTNLYFCYSVGNTIQLVSSADGGATWATQSVDVSGAVMNFASYSVFVPGFGLGYTGGDIAGDEAFVFIPLAGGPPPVRRVGGSAGGSTVQPRCCIRPYTPQPRERLTEPDLSPPLNSQRVFSPTVFPAPSDALVHVMGQYQVPLGFYFQLEYLVLTYLGAGWVPGDGNVQFSLDVNQSGIPTAQGVPVPFYNPVLTPLGSLQKPWPVHPGALSMLSPRDILRAKVQTNPLVILPPPPGPGLKVNQFVAAFVGHLWPVN